MSAWDDLEAACRQWTSVAIRDLVESSADRGAKLNQIAAEYRGNFFNDAISLDLGVRAPYFDRELNNYCYQRDTFNAYCTTQVGTPVAGTDLVTFPASSMNSRLMGEYRLSHTSRNAKLRLKMSLLRSPLDRLSKSRSLPSSVMDTDKSLLNLTVCGNPIRSKY